MLTTLKPKTLILPLFLQSFSSNATEVGGSNYLPGFYGDLAMAVFPGQGTYFNNFLAAYQDTSSQTGTLLEMPGVIHVSDKTLLGGTYVVGFFPGLMTAKDNAADTARAGLGDFYLVPAGLNWQWGDLTGFLFEGIVAPTGYYKRNEFNLGRNYWTFDHNLLLTWNLPANNEISVALGYMNNLKNPATQYQSGDEFHFDYTVGHYPTPNFGLGVTGSYYQQVGHDRAPADLLANEPGDATTIGPVVMYMPKINGQDTAISLKWLREVSVSGRPAQEYVVCRFLMSF